MSRIRIVEGSITKRTGGTHYIYSEGDITFNAKGFIRETATEHTYGEPIKSTFMKEELLSNSLIKTETNDESYLLKSVEYNRKSGDYIIKETVLLSNRKTFSRINEFGATIKVMDTVATIANFTALINSKSKIISNTCIIEITKAVTESDVLNVLDMEKVISTETRKAYDNKLVGPMAKTFEGNVDGMKDLLVPLKNDLQKFKNMTPDVPGAADGPTGGFGRLEEILVNEVRGTARQYSSAITKSHKSKLEDNDFINAGYIIFSKALNQIKINLTNKK